MTVPVQMILLTMFLAIDILLMLDFRRSQRKYLLEVSIPNALSVKGVSKK